MGGCGTYVIVIGPDPNRLIMRMFRALAVRRITPWLARLALFVLLFQISAIDHHTHSHINEVTGVVGSSAHEMHCHGALGTCASSGSDMPAVMTQPWLLPAQPSLAVLGTSDAVRLPADAEIAVPSQPPRI